MARAELLFFFARLILFGGTMARRMPWWISAGRGGEQSQRTGRRRGAEGLLRLRCLGQVEAKAASPLGTSSHWFTPL